MGYKIAREKKKSLFTDKCIWYYNSRLAATFISMRLFFLFLFSCSCLSAISQHDGLCRTNLYLEARFEVIPSGDSSVLSNKNSSAKIDSSISQPRTGYICKGGYITKYKLIPPSKGFKVLGFVISVETVDGDFIESNCSGDELCSMAKQSLFSRKPGSPIFIECIKVQTNDGKIYILKPLTVYL